MESATGNALPSWFPSKKHHFSVRVKRPSVMNFTLLVGNGRPGNIQPSGPDFRARYLEPAPKSNTLADSKQCRYHQSVLGCPSRPLTHDSMRHKMDSTSSKHVGSTRQRKHTLLIHCHSGAGMAPCNSKPLHPFIFLYTRDLPSRCAQQNRT